MADLDHDGALELLSGSGPGWVYRFRIGPHGWFTAPVRLRDRGGEWLRPAGYASVFAADWTGDGVADLLATGPRGGVVVIENEGIQGELLYGAPRPLQAGGRPLAVPGGHAAPVVADWDGDGRRDLIVGSASGAVFWFPNPGPGVVPRLAAGRQLLPPCGGAPADRPGREARIAVADWDGDGRLDLLIGDHRETWGWAEADRPVEAERTRLRAAWEAARRPVAGERAADRHRRLARAGALGRQLVRYERAHPPRPKAAVRRGWVWWVRRTDGPRRRNRDTGVRTHGHRSAAPDAGVPGGSRR